MRMPRTSSFSVRDILDLPQIKASAASATAPDDTQTSTPTAALSGNATGHAQQTALPFPPNGKYSGFE